MNGSCPSHVASPIDVVPFSSVSQLRTTNRGPAMNSSPVPDALPLEMSTPTSLINTSCYYWLTVPQAWSSTSKELDPIVYGPQDLAAARDQSSHTMAGFVSKRSPTTSLSSTCSGSLSSLSSDETLKTPLPFSRSSSPTTTYCLTGCCAVLGYKGRCAKIPRWSIPSPPISPLPAQPVVTASTNAAVRLPLLPTPDEMDQLLGQSRRFVLPRIKRSRDYIYDPISTNEDPFSNEDHLRHHDYNARSAVTEHGLQNDGADASSVRSQAVRPLNHSLLSAGAPWQQAFTSSSRSCSVAVCSSSSSTCSLNHRLRAIRLQPRYRPLHNRRASGTIMSPCATNTASSSSSGSSSSRSSHVGTPINNKQDEYNNEIQELLHHGYPRWWRETENSS